MRKPWLIGGVGAVIAALVTAGVMERWKPRWRSSSV